MSEIDQALLEELRATFRVEAADHLQLLNEALLNLERAPEADVAARLIQEAFRAAHSLKGAARAVNRHNVEALAHAIESVFQQVRDNSLTLSPDVCDILYDSLDMLAVLLNDQEADVEPLILRLSGLVATNQTAAKTPARESAAPEVSSQTIGGDDTIRVAVSKLDDLMAQVGELLISRIGSDQRLRDSHLINRQLEELSKSWHDVVGIARRFNGESAAKLDDLLRVHGERLQALAHAHGTLDAAISRDALRLSVVTNSLQEQVRRVRMVPFQTLALMLERAVRDAAHSEGKEVNFSIDGSAVELDKRVLEQLKDPLLHLLRNAVVHGIETPEQRLDEGKPEAGTVEVMVRQRGSEVRITVSDDGRGFDLDALRESAARHGLAERSAETEDLLKLAFMPGVSTNDSVSALAGRGVGLDVVRQATEAMHGRIGVDSVPGQGASIELIVPTSLAITRGLIVQVGMERYVVPLLSIEKIVPLDDNFAVGGRQLLRVEGTPLPLISLADALERPVDASMAAARPLALVLAVAEQRIAVMVDDVLTEQEFAVKPLAFPLQRVRNIMGAALLGSGEPIMVLNPVDLIRSQHHVRSVPVANQKSEAVPIVRVLVVDDSITTRTLEKNILEAAGYDVTTATDGVQALQRIKERGVDIVVSDVQMPNMDGFTLTQTLRESQDYSKLPVILVTSLENREDRERGLHAGANAYIIKRGFDQAELLATIQQLV